jgi:hypothetical protein
MYDVADLGYTLFLQGWKVPAEHMNDESVMAIPPEVTDARIREMMSENGIDHQEVIDDVADIISEMCDVMPLFTMSPDYTPRIH